MSAASCRSHVCPPAPVHAAPDDVQVELSGTGAFQFEDDGTAGHRLLLVKPAGRSELHLVGGRLVIDCNSTSETPLVGVDLRSTGGQGHVVFLEDATMQRMTMAIAADGSNVTLHGGELVAEGVQLASLTCPP